MNAPLALRRLDTAAPGFDAELAALIAFEAGQDPAIDATVAQIVGDVRARGDAALLDYTRRFDRLDAASVAALEITAAQMHDAYASLPTAQSDALGAAAARIRALPRAAEGPRLELHRSRRHGTGPARDAARPRRRLRAGRQGGLSVVGADERHSRARRRRARNRHGRADARRRAQSAGARGGAPGRRDARVHDRRRAGGRGAGLRHADDSRRRQDLRSGQCLCRGRQAPRVRRRRHRHGRRRLGNPDHRRCDGQSGLDRARPLRPGRARRNGAGAAADARCRPARARRGERATPDRGHAARGASSRNRSRAAAR